MFEEDKNSGLYEMIQETFSMLDADELPQTAQALSHLLDENNTEDLPSPLALANGIMELDKPMENLRQICGHCRLPFRPNTGAQRQSVPA